MLEQFSDKFLKLTSIEILCDVNGKAILSFKVNDPHMPENNIVSFFEYYEKSETFMVRLKNALNIIERHYEEGEIE
jgi:hypothetical protein